MTLGYITHKFYARAKKYMDYERNKYDKAVHDVIKYCNTKGKKSMSIDECIKLINSDNSLMDNLQIIVDTSITEQKSLSTISNNQLFNDLILAFCTINNIEYFNFEKCPCYEVEEVRGDLNIVQQYLSELEPPLSENDEKELLVKIANGDNKAKEIFIKHNLRLVITVALRYIRNYNDSSFLDLVEEGNIGLIRAVENFDVKKGNKFSTYAFWWIRQAMSRTIYNYDRNIKIPEHIYRLFSNYKNAERELTIKLGREPSMQEVANYMNVDIEQIKIIMFSVADSLRLDYTISNDSDNSDLTSLIEFVPADDDVEGEVEKRITSLNFMEIFNSCDLTDKEKFVLRNRYGLDGSERKTLEEISQEMDITRERVRQIEASALRKLRLNPQIRMLAGVPPLDDNCSKRPKSKV